MRGALATTASAGAQRAKAEAIQLPFCRSMDCFVSLAMTVALAV
jgi:hypothetical protein